MFTFSISPENRIAVETVLLIVCAVAAMFVSRPVRHAEKAKASRPVTGN